MFMGCEFGQTTEWSEAYSVDWSNLDGWGHEYHHGIKRLVRDLNHTYKAHPALWSQDFTQDGFQWVKADDGNNSILGYVRYGADGSTILAVCNFAGTSQPSYGMWVPFDGEWELILNTDDAVYEGAGNELARNLTSCDNNLQLHIPANSVQWYKLR